MRYRCCCTTIRSTSRAKSEASLRSTVFGCGAGVAQAVCIQLSMWLFISKGALPEVQVTTGPGNLTRSIFEVVATIAVRRKRCSLCTIGRRLPPVSGH